MNPMFFFYFSIRMLHMRSFKIFCIPSSSPKYRPRTCDTSAAAMGGDTSARLTIYLFPGGVASAFFWGIVGDVFGRRNCLSMTLLLDATITLAQSTVPDYRLLLAARTINGFIIGKFYCILVLYIFCSFLFSSCNRILFILHTCYMCIWFC